MDPPPVERRPPLDQAQVTHGSRVEPSAVTSMTTTGHRRRRYRSSRTGRTRATDGRARDGDRGRKERAGSIDLPRIERAVREILVAIGEDPERDGLRATPPGWPRCTPRSSPGCTRTRAATCGVTFEAGHDEMVMVKDIPVYSMCEHHLVPWFGRAHVAYIPNEDGRITGLSKLARLVDGFSRRPQVQERLTTQVADAIERVLAPTGRAGRGRGRASLHVHAGRAQARAP